MEGKAIYSIKPELVKVDERIRKEFKPMALERLAKSIKERGQLQNGVCIHLPNGDVRLVAGERRLRACILAGVEFSYALYGDVEEDVLLEIELEENVVRENLTWQEEVNGLWKLVQFRQKKFGAEKPGGRIVDVAEHLNRAIGGVSDDVKLAIFADKIPQVKDAGTKSEAMKIIKRLEETLHQKKALDKAIEEKKRVEPAPTSGERGGEALQGEGPVLTPVQVRLVHYHKMVFEGKMEDVLPTLDKASDIVLFEPPWGVNLEEVSDGGGEKEHFDDSPEVFEEGLERWLSLLYAHMAENSHLYMFFPITKHEFTYTLLEKVGFTTNRMPIIWWKKGAHVVRTPEVWPGRSYEPIAFARKGKKKLVRLGAPDMVVTPPPSPSLKGIHPSAKHPDVFIDLVRRSIYPGDRVLDPMCGSGMLGVAMESKAILPFEATWRMVEKSPSHRLNALGNVVKGYGEILKEEESAKVLESDIPEGESGPPKADFRSLAPGGPEWKEYWKAHPEHQEEMLKWKQTMS